MSPPITNHQARTLGAALLAGLCVCAAWPARADDLEREKLARIAGELKVVEQMVDQAQQSAQSYQPTGQVRFRYDWLDRDLQMIREGIEQQIDAPRQPRPVPPLRGDYRY
jgi:RAQPRD family integrative conjugative element protein